MSRTIPTTPVALQSASYMNLATFRKSGAQVNTPVWFADDPGDSQATLYVFSAGNAGKVKRLRNSATARVAPCSVTGTLLGEWHDAEAFLIDSPEEIRHAHQCLRKKYGWQMTGVDFMSFLSRKINKRAFIKVILKET